MNRIPWIVVVLAAGLSPEALAGEPLPARVQETVRQAEAAGLPVGPFEAKAQEGLAKGVPEDRVEALLLQMRERMREADGALGELARGADRAELLQAATRARTAGASGEGLVEAARHTHRVAAMWCLGDLLGAGVGEREALRLVAQASQGGDPAGRYREMVTAMQRMQGLGMGPVAAAQQMSQTMAHGQPPLAAVPEQAGGPVRSGGDAGQGGGSEGHGN